MLQFLHTGNYYGYFRTHLVFWHSGSYILYCVLDYLVDYVNFHVIGSFGDASLVSGRDPGKLIGLYFFSQKNLDCGFSASPALVLAG